MALSGQNEVPCDQDMQEVLAPKGADENDGSSPHKTHRPTAFCRLDRLPAGDPRGRAGLQAVESSRTPAF